MPEFAFDTTLVCAIRVKADTKEAAADLLREQVDGASANLGCWPGGEPILCEVSVEGDVDLYEIDGEPVDGEPL
jgi:hypothetical protein